MTLFEAVRRVRTLLGRDFGGDVGNEDWPFDDTLCQFKNLDLVEFIDDARTAYCERQPIRDSSSALTAPVLEADAGGVVPVGLPILAVRSVALASAPATLLPAKALLTLEREWPDWRGETGTPLYWVPDYDQDTIRLVPDPQAETTLALTIDRLPLAPLNWESDHAAQIADFPAAEHRVACWYAAARALEASDNEQHGLVQSWEALVLRHWGPPVLPVQRAVRRRLAAGPMRVRTVGF